LDEDNFEEAKYNIFKSFVKTKIPANVQRVLDDPKISAERLESLTSVGTEPFWILSAALKMFIDRHYNQMPISGRLPDMISDTKRYTQLLELYRKKALEHAIELHEIVNSILERPLNPRVELMDDPDPNNDDSSSSSSPSICNNQDSCCSFSSSPAKMSTGVPWTIPDCGSHSHAGTMDDDGELSRMSVSSSNGIEIPPPMDGIRSFTWSKVGPRTINFDHPNHHQEISLDKCKEFCKNASKIGIQYGNSPEKVLTKGLEDLLARIDKTDFESTPPCIDPLIWFVLLRIADHFQSEKGYFPGTVVAHRLTDSRELRRISNSLLTNSKLIPEQAIDEFCRYGSSEPHVLAAMLAGCVAQEAIKLCTHQYIPIDNALVLDGHSQTATTFRI